MREKLQIASKILSLFEEIWFSDTLLGLFIVFPAGMWAMMALIICATCLTATIPHIIAVALLLIGGVVTILLGVRRSHKKDNSD